MPWWQQQQCTLSVEWCPAHTRRHLPSIVAPLTCDMCNKRVCTTMPLCARVCVRRAADEQAPKTVRATAPPPSVCASAFSGPRCALLVAQARSPRAAVASRVDHHGLACRSRTCAARLAAAAAVVAGGGMLGNKPVATAQPPARAHRRPWQQPRRASCPARLLQRARAAGRCGAAWRACLFSARGRSLFFTRVWHTLAAQVECGCAGATEWITSRDDACACVSLALGPRTAFFSGRQRPAVFLGHSSVHACPLGHALFATPSTQDDNLPTFRRATAATADARSIANTTPRSSLHIRTLCAVLRWLCCWVMLGDAVVWWWLSF